MWKKKGETQYTHINALEYTKCKWWHFSAHYSKATLLRWPWILWYELCLLLVWILLLMISNISDAFVDEQSSKFMTWLSWLETWFGFLVSRLQTHLWHVWQLILWWDRVQQQVRGIHTPYSHNGAETSSTYHHHIKPRATCWSETICAANHPRSYHRHHIVTPHICHIRPDYSAFDQPGNPPGQTPDHTSHLSARQYRK